MCATGSGFDIAEADLELRGPGEFRGVRQSGLSDLRMSPTCSATCACSSRPAAKPRPSCSTIPALPRPNIQALARLAQRYDGMAL
ncbi:MAG: hypothetical protein ACOX5J_09690 [Candidatus Hydrogenedentales bacterium]